MQNGKQGEKGTLSARPSKSRWPDEEEIFRPQVEALSKSRRSELLDRNILEGSVRKRPEKGGRTGGESSFIQTDSQDRSRHLGEVKMTRLNCGTQVKKKLPTVLEEGSRGPQKRPEKRRKKGGG